MWFCWRRSLEIEGFHLYGNAIVTWVNQTATEETHNKKGTWSEVWERHILGGRRIGTCQAWSRRTSRKVRGTAVSGRELCPSVRGREEAGRLMIREAHWVSTGWPSISFIRILRSWAVWSSLEPVLNWTGGNGSYSCLAPRKTKYNRRDK